MIYLEENQKEFVFFLYEKGNPTPVKYKNISSKSVKETLIKAADLLFRNTEPEFSEKIIKLKQLGVSEVVVTDSTMGRILYKKPIEIFLNDYCIPDVVKLWNDTESLN